jgi:hypothetical protein
MTRRINAQQEHQLLTEILDPRIADNPYAFVLFAFPWGKKGTPLERYNGPRAWQKRELLALAAHIKANKERDALGLEPVVYKSAKSSGRGIGKSSLVAWLVLWMMSTRIGSTTIVTANTEPQLKSRTWAELGKWHTLAINGHWFDRSALSLKPVTWFDEAIKQQLKIDTGYYYAQAQLWSEDNPDAFAGAHNPLGIQVIFDEASGIPKPIWVVTEGFFTEPVVDRYQFAYSNPRRNTGQFFECFHKDRAYWRTESIDSRTVEGTDKAYLQSIVERYGEDSDTTRVEVKGQFPRVGDKQFISREDVDGARLREVVADSTAPLVMGIDPARYGSNKAVIRFRQGRDAKSIPAVKFKGLSTTQLAFRCAELIDKYNPDGICVDGGGVGGGVVDQLKHMGYRVIEVNFGGHADEGDRWANKRAELWGRMRDWLPGGVIDGDSELADDLCGPEYEFIRQNVIALESKESMEKRGLASPDDGDALALTFAARFARHDAAASRRGRKNVLAKDVDYDIFGR